jgi:hypothetical protein
VENSLKMQKLQGEKLAARIEGRGVDLKWSDMVDGIEDCERETTWIQPPSGMGADNRSGRVYYRCSARIL